MTRTIVMSDPHGSRALFDRILEHAGFDDTDRLVVAGDLIDVGGDDIVACAESLEATILAGNHEIAAALGIRISPQSPGSLDRGPEFAERFVSGAWPLAIAVDGWLITHAGVSAALADIIAEENGDPDRIAETLNRRFREEVTEAAASRPLPAAGLDRYRLLGGEQGPLWFRPADPNLLPAGLRQIAGHTPPELLGAPELAAIEAAGWLLIEPGGHDGDPLSGGRYALVEGGDARVVAL